MTKLSPIPLKKKDMKIVTDSLWEAIASLESKKEIEGFFFDLLTHTERKMIAKRFQVAILLIEGYSYFDIKSSLGVTDNTITKINNWLKTGATSLAKTARKLAEEQEYSKEKEEIRGRYMPGDLLMPAMEVGVKLAKRQLKKYRRKKILRKRSAH